jgi:hypothetical protein
VAGSATLTSAVTPASDPRKTPHRVREAMGTRPFRRVVPDTVRSGLVAAVVFGVFGLLLALGEFLLALAWALVAATATFIDAVRPLPGRPFVVAVLALLFITNWVAFGLGRADELPGDLLPALYITGHALAGLIGFVTGRWETLAVAFTPWILVGLGLEKGTDDAPGSYYALFNTLTLCLALVFGIVLGKRAGLARQRRETRSG